MSPFDNYFGQFIRLFDHPTILVTFARPEESRAFRRRLASHGYPGRAHSDLHLGMIGSIPVTVAHSGIGPEAAATAMNRLLPIATWSHIIAAGFAGGLDPQLQLADIVIESRPSPHPPRLISRPLPVETVEEKARVFRETKAAAVDMETDTIAASCQGARLPMTAIRAISDPANTALPVPFATWFDVKHQRPKPAALLAFLARHPWRIPAFVRFLRALTPVSKSLAAAVSKTVEQLPKVISA